ncbi:MAG: restriction endonuclease [Thermomonas sp.]|nr:restriction endonuclease [Thermomonas sp.]
MILPVPEFARWINPVLRALGELGGSARPREVVERVAQNEQVPDDVLDLLNPSGGQRFSNQVHWARFFLADAGFIDRSKRGVWKLTEAANAAGQLSASDLLDLVREVQERSRSTSLAAESDASPPVAVVDVSPQVTLSVDPSSEAPPPDHEEGDYKSRLLKVLQSLAPSGFERLCQRLLREAGFEQVVVTGKSNDGGIDGHGVLSVNHFVSFRVLFQCKRYSGTVAPAQVRDFRGAMQGRADKGLILTTGSFTTEAKREASRDGAPPIELVDGDELVELFAKLELGLRPVTTYEVDESFFAEYL